MEIKYEPFRHVWYVEKDGIICYVPEFAVEYIKGVESENAKLRENLKSLMMGTNAELCAGRDESDCKKCSMYHGEDGCIVVNTMKLLGIDMYGEPLRIEVEK
jgi:hypothetical protein